MEIYITARRHNTNTFAIDISFTKYKFKLLQYKNKKKNIIGKTPTPTPQNITTLATLAPKTPQKFLT